MAQVSRPLLIALVAVVVLFGVWMVALRPHGSSSSAPAAQSAPAPAASPQPARAPRPVSTPHAHRAAAAALSASAPRHVHRGLPASRPVSRPSPSGRLAAVELAMAQQKVLALLFYNPSAADDQAVRQELASVPAHGGQVFKLAIPLTELSSYTAVTSQVPVNISPTLVIIDRKRSAQEIAGFADSFEIAQRLQDALSARAG